MKLFITLFGLISAYSLAPSSALAGGGTSAEEITLYHCQSAHPVDLNLTDWGGLILHAWNAEGTPTTQPRGSGLETIVFAGIVADGKSNPPTLFRANFSGALDAAPGTVGHLKTSLESKVIECIKTAETF